MAASLKAADRETDRLELQKAAAVMEEIMHVPDDIPQELLDESECVIVVPSVRKLAIGIDGRYGQGAMVCRTGTFKAQWGAPAMFALEGGGSFGFQLGEKATALVLLVMKTKGADLILSRRVKLGGDTSVAAGPNAQTVTDAYMRAEILSYSRSRGVLAGFSVAGSTIRPDNDANERVYGHKFTAREIVMDNKVAVPKAGRHLVDVLEKLTPRDQSKKVSTR
jgi:lipid-binding SYLF domain-containing protein